MQNIDREYKAPQKLGGKIITAADKTYPLALSATDNVIGIMMNFSDNSLRGPPVNMVNFTPDIPVAMQGKNPVDAQEIILSYLSFTPILVDELVWACHLTIAGVQSNLLELELAGCVERFPGNKISLLEQEDIN